MKKNNELTKKQQEEREKYFNGEKKIKIHRNVSKEDNKKTSKIISSFILENDLSDIII